jgi:hypothetical protein
MPLRVKEHEKRQQRRKVSRTYAPATQTATPQPVILDAGFTPAPVLVYNCTSLLLTSLLVNSSQFAPSDGVAGISSPGTAPSYISVPRVIPGGSPSGPGFINGSGGSQVVVSFYGTTAWTQYVYINQVLNVTMFLWCYTNGFVLVDQGGKVSQLYVQSSSPFGVETATSLTAEVERETAGGGHFISVRLLPEP